MTRLSLLHLQGFNPEAAPKFEWPAELIALHEFHQQLKDPKSEGGDRWVELEGHHPSLLPNLRSGGSQTETAIIFVNLTDTEISYYWVDGAGEERHYGKIAAGDFANQHTYAGHIWLVKNADGGNLAVFCADEKTGRALLGAAQSAQEKLRF